MTALRDVILTEGLPMALYTDRAHWAFNTPQANGPVNRRQLMQVGRALDRLGIEHIPAYSPQPSGRSERLNRTFQDRLVNELRVAKITTLAAANAYLRERFDPGVQRHVLGARPGGPASAFVPLGPVDLEQILCHQETRLVARDNTVTFKDRTFQLARQPGRGRVWGWKSRSGGISTASTRFGTAPDASATTRPCSSARGTDERRCSPWKLPQPWTPKARPPLLL
jgi:hypothetical protein